MFCQQTGEQNVGNQYVSPKHYPFNNKPDAVKRATTMSWTAYEIQNYVLALLQTSPSF